MANDADVTATSSVSMKSVDNVNVNKNPCTTNEPDRKSGDPYKREVEVNELLCFLSSKFNNYPVAMIKKSVLNSTVRMSYVLLSRHC